MEFLNQAEGQQKRELQYEQIRDQIAVLAKREERYLCVAKLPTPASASPSNQRWSPVSVMIENHLTVEQTTRSTVCDWMYKIVDHFSLERETIPIGMSCFDRYTAKKPSCSKHECQLVAVTSLFIAVKVYDVRRKDTLHFFARMSSGRFSESDIEAMETKILFGLNWLVNPPTPQSFVYQFIHLFLCMAPNLSCYAMTIYEVANYIAEVSLLQPQVRDEKASTLAFASLLVALREVKNTILNPQDYANFVRTILSFGFVSADKVASVADNIEDSLQSDDGHLTTEQVYERLDPTGAVYGTVE